MNEEEKYKYFFEKMKEFGFEFYDFKEDVEKLMKEILEIN